MFANFSLFKEMLSVAPKCTIAFVYSLFAQVFTNLCVFSRMWNASVQRATIFTYFINYYLFIFIYIYLNWTAWYLKRQGTFFIYTVFSVTYYMAIEVHQCCVSFC